MNTWEGTEPNTQPTLALVTHALDERRATDDVWHELATGALSPEQVATMRRHLEPPEAIERKLKLFGPTSQEARERTLDMLLERYYPPPLESDGGQVVPLQAAARRGARRWWTAGFTGVAVAAAMLLVWVVQPPKHSEGLALPTFDLEPQDGLQGAMRGAGDVVEPEIEGCDPSFHAYPQDRSLSVVLRPKALVDADLSVAVFAESKAGWTGWLEPSSKVNGEGVLTIDQPVAELGLTPGAWTLTFYVVQTGHDYPKQQLRTLEPSEHPDVAIVPWSVCIVE